MKHSLRMELNRMLTFTGVTDSNFHSTYRRALVIEIHARFADAAYYRERMVDGHLNGANHTRTAEDVATLTRTVDGRTQVAS